MSGDADVIRNFSHELVPNRHVDPTSGTAGLNDVWVAVAPVRQPDEQPVAEPDLGIEQPG